MLAHNYTIIEFFLPVLDCSEFRRGLGLLCTGYQATRKERSASVADNYSRLIFII